MKRRSLACMLLGVVVALVAACESTPRGEEIATKPSPISEQVLVSKHNERVAKLDRLWAGVGMRLTSVNKQGEKIDEVADGVLQFVRPRKVFLSVRKLGETYLQIGSDDTRYWWIDLADKNRRVAMVGTHEKASPDRIARLGLPVHPLDLVELCAITPLPTGGKVSASADGDRIEWTGTARWGTRTVSFDAKSLLPRGVELRDRTGKTVATSKLDEYEDVPILDDSKSVARAPTLIVVEIPHRQTSVRFSLTNPQNRGKRIAASAFDFEGLLNAYGVKEVRSLDDPPSQRDAKPAAKTGDGG